MAPVQVENRIAAMPPIREGLATPPGDYTAWADYMRDFVNEYAGVIAPDDVALCTRISKAMRLAPTITVFRALLDGQRVPVSALDPGWARRYGLR